MQSTHLREHNLAVVFRTVVSADSPVSRAGVAKQTKLAKPTVSKLVEELLDAGLITEEATISHGSGRPMVPLLPATGSVVGIGAEIAADHISCLAIDLTGKVIAQHSERIGVRDLPVDEVVEITATMAEQIRQRADPAVAVGLCASVPGRLAPDRNTILSAPNLGWQNVPFVEQIMRRSEFAGVDIHADNDSRLAARTEVERRPGASFVYLRGETGVGGAVVLDGKVLAGERGWAGEFGHTVVVPDGEQCRCGRRGCLEAYISYHALRLRTGLSEDVRVHDIIAELTRTMERPDVIAMIGRPLGMALANAMNILDLSTVVLSGYLGPIANELTPIVRSTIEQHALSAEVAPIILERADGPEQSALWGAARSALAPVLTSPGRWITRVA